MNNVSIHPLKVLEVMGNIKLSGYVTSINMTLMSCDLGDTRFTAKHGISKRSSVKEPSHNHPNSNKIVCALTMVLDLFVFIWFLLDKIVCCQKMS